MLLSAAQCRRRDRDWWYRACHSAPGKKFVECDRGLAPSVKAMVRGKMIHEKLDRLNDDPCANGKLAAFRAHKQGHIDKPTFRNARAVLVAADEAKHVPAADFSEFPPLPLASVVGPLRAHCGPDQGRWQ